MPSKKKTTKKKARKPAKPRAPRPAARRQPETLRLRSISPSFTANDLQRSIAFYRDVLGFVVGDEWRGENGVLNGCEMRAGGVVFVLNQDDFAKGRDRKKGLGTSLYVSTAQDIDRLASEIKARGGTLDQEPADMPWGQRIFTITDPDGFRLTIAQER
jgi:lactoylglutathione lyase